MARRRLTPLLAAVALFALGCVGQGPSPGDSGVLDAGRPDAREALDAQAGADAEPWEADSALGPADARIRPDAALTGADALGMSDARPEDASPAGPDAAAGGPYSIAGNAGVAFATVTAAGLATTADATGAYLLQWIPPGTYQVSPAQAGCTFAPPTRPVTVGPDAVGQSFAASCAGAPAPTPINLAYALGAYYMPKPRHPGHQWAELRMLNAKDQSKPAGQRMPLMGYYQGDNPTVLDWQIKWAVDRGIVYFVFDDYWTDSGAAPGYEGPLRAFLQAPHRASMQFAVPCGRTPSPGSAAPACARIFWARCCLITRPII
jgi:hypothetical protein